MKEEIFEGKTEEEALLKASETLGLNISEMDYEVIEQDAGLFGLFRRSVKIKVRVPEKLKGDAGAVSELQPVATPVQKGPAAEEVLRSILQKMGIPADVSCEEDEESVRLNIVTEERDVVIGRDGEVLSALQFVVNKIVNRQPEGRKRVVLDADGFRDKRADELTKMAERLGQKAVRLGRIIRLTGMNAQDRRIIHMALKDKPGLTTRSEGEGLFRYLMIVPNNVQRPKTAAGRGTRGFRGRRRPQGSRGQS